MEFRKAEIFDLESIAKIIEDAKDFLKDNKVSQWQDGYPEIEDLKKDIEKGESYVLLKDSEVIGTSVISLEGESTYNTIEDGKWLSSDKYIVMHRVAISSKYRGKNIFKELICEAEKIALDNYIYSIKIDTHKDNKAMQRALCNNGFTKCGIIFLEDGSERVAYEKLL